MAKKKKSAEQVADEITALIWEDFKRFPEEEQERRLRSAERFMAKVSRADNRRTASSTLRTGRSRASRRAR
jgi:hypothetical protein